MTSDIKARSSARDPRQRRLPALTDLELADRVLADLGGPAWAHLCERLAVEAYPIFVNYGRTGALAIAAKRAGAPGLARLPTGLKLQRSDAEALAVEIVRVGLRRFHLVALERWDPGRGLGLNEFFRNWCSRNLPDAYDAWRRRESRQNDWLSDQYAATLIDGEPGPEATVLAAEWIEELTGADPVSRLVLRLKMDGHSLQAIAEQLNEEGLSVTVAQVRRQLARLERRARWLRGRQKDAYCGLLFVEQVLEGLVSPFDPGVRTEFVGRVERYYGQEIEDSSRGFVYRFGHVLDALAASSRTVRAGLRLAVHTAPTRLVELGQAGAALTAVSALGRAAHGGQVLVSAAAREAVGGVLPAGTSLLRAGHWFSASGETPSPVFQLLRKGGPVELPPPRAGGAGLGDVPIPGRQLVGRESELASLTAALRPGRVVTLVGVGGIGKTRLAVEMAARATPERFPKGVRFCDMSMISTPEELIERLAVLLDQPALIGDASGPTNLRREVVKALHRRLLLVLDGCDRLTADVSRLLHDVIAAGSQVTVLATSRRPLGVPRELVQQIGPLSDVARDPGEIAPSAHLLRLAVEGRGTSACPGPVLEEIARKTGAVPLGIELVAPLFGQLEPGELGQRIGAAAPARLSPEVGLRAALDTSASLLDEADARLFALVSLFCGGWTIDRAVCLAEAAGVEPASVPAGMTRLVHRALVRSEVAGQEGPVRYRMHDVVRDYAEELLVLSGLGPTAAAAHAACFFELTRSAVESRRTLYEAAWVREVDVEFDNIRSAQRWFVEQGRHGEALEMVWHLADDVMMRGRHEVGGWAEALAGQPGVAAERMRGAALALASNTALLQNDLERAERLAEQSLCSSSADDPWRWIALNTLALVAATTSDEASCERLLIEAAGSVPAKGDRFGCAVTFYEVVQLSWLIGEPARGAPFALALAGSIDDRSSPTLRSMAELAAGLTTGEDPSKASGHLRRARQLAASTGNSLLALHAWRAEHLLVLPSADRATEVAQLIEIADAFQSEGNFSELNQTLVDILWHLLSMGEVDAAMAICGYVGQTRYRHIERFQMAERRLRTMRDANGQPIWPTDAMQAARRAGSAMTPQEVVHFVRRTMRAMGEDRCSI